MEYAIKQFPDSDKKDSWRLLLSKINKENTDPNEFNVSPNNISKQVKSNPSLGEKIRILKNQLPEFNLNYDLADDSMETFYPIEIPRAKTEEFFELKNEIKKMICQGKISENEGDFKLRLKFIENLLLKKSMIHSHMNVLL